ncbi:hypothetical protein ACFZAV_21760 [Streptomyces sp. NPDC008343]|uniref:hypothetical protein n=1 Tax=Streptomyces sp. NPDC008343 TaxID=3364828 RepID=UPI0036F0C256
MTPTARVGPRGYGGGGGGDEADGPEGGGGQGGHIDVCVDLLEMVQGLYQAVGVPPSGENRRVELTGPRRQALMIGTT